MRSPLLKILHVAQDPELSRVPSGAIHGIAQNVTLAWAGSPARALRAARLDTAVVVVGGSGRLETAIAALNSGADGYLPAGPSLERDLPELVAEAIDRASSRTRERAEMAGELAAQRRQLARESRTCAVLQQQALQLEDALVRLDKRRADEAAAFAELFDERRRAFDEKCVELLESRDALAAELADARSALEREREARVADRAAAERSTEVLESHRDALAAALADARSAL